MERTPTLCRINNQLQERPWPSTTEWPWLYRIAAQKEEYWPKKRKASPLLELPLELRIMIYEYTFSDQEYNITERHYGYRLPSLFHVHPQITHEIYRSCPITAVVDIAMPPVLTPWVIFNPSFLYKVFCASAMVCFAISRPKRYRNVERRKQLVMKARIKCLPSERECKGLDIDEPCPQCLDFARKDWRPEWGHVCQLC